MRRPWFLITYKKEWFLQTVEELVEEDKNFFCEVSHSTYRISLSEQEQKRHPKKKKDDE